MEFRDLKPGDKFILIHAHRRLNLTPERPVLVKLDPKCLVTEHLTDERNAVYLDKGIPIRVWDDTEVFQVTKVTCDDQYEGVERFLI